jgi:hypothetical protein
VKAVNARPLVLLVKEGLREDRLKANGAEEEFCGHAVQLGT